VLDLLLFLLESVRQGRSFYRNSECILVISVAWTATHEHNTHKVKNTATSATSNGCRKRCDKLPIRQQLVATWTTQSCPRQCITLQHTEQESLSALDRPQTALRGAWPHTQTIHVALKTPHHLPFQHQMCWSGGYNSLFPDLGTVLHGGGGGDVP